MTEEKKVSQDVSALVEKMGEQIAKAIAEANKSVDTKEVEETLKKDLYTAPSASNGVIAYPSDLKSLSKDEKIVTWFKSLVNKDHDLESAQVYKALVEGTDSEGGYLVPEEFRAEVFRILPDFSVMRRLARVLPMNTDTLNLNTLGARPSARWSTEYSSLSTSSAGFGRVTLNPHTLVCLLPISRQLLADANINMVQFITELFAEEIARAEDKAFFTGSGTGQPKGISQETLKSVNAGGAIDFNDMIDLYYKVPQRIRGSRASAFVANHRTIANLRKVKDTNGQYIWTPSVQEGRPDMVLGKPLYEQNDLADGEVYWGGWDHYIIGDREQLSVETTTTGGDAWRRHSMEIKAVERVDGKAVLTSAFAKITNG